MVPYKPPSTPTVSPTLNLPPTSAAPNRPSKAQHHFLQPFLINRPDRGVHQIVLPKQSKVAALAVNSVYVEDD